MLADELLPAVTLVEEVWAGIGGWGWRECPESYHDLYNSCDLQVAAIIQKPNLKERHRSGMTT
jgi:hypothetical protein